VAVEGGSSIAEPTDRSGLGEDGEPRRRRRRGGRGRGRGRGRGEEGLEGQEAQEGQDAVVQEEARAPVTETPRPRRQSVAATRDVVEEDEELPPTRRAPRATPFGSVWDSQLGTPTAPAASLSPIVDDDEDFDEPEIPEYLIAEQRRGANRGGGRGARGGRSAYQAAMERERFGRGGAPGGGGGGGQRSPGRGINRYPDVSARPRPAGPAREERGYGRQERSSVPPPPRGSSEPWSDVPPELEALLRAQVAQKPGPGPAPARGGRVEPEAPSGAEPTEQLEPAAPVETAAAKPRATRKPSTRSRAGASAPAAGVSATATPDVADRAAVAEVSTPAPKRRTTRTSKTAAVAKAAPALDEAEPTPAATPSKAKARATRKPSGSRTPAADVVSADADPGTGETAAATPAAPRRRASRKASTTEGA
jgi:hypothetical protein